jgi:hypothetical protein
VSRSVEQKRVGDNTASSDQAIVDQLGEEVFGIPPNLKTGLLTGLIGTIAGVVSLKIYFFFAEPDHYVAPDWLIFVALGAIAGFFLRLEQPIYRDLYHHQTQALSQGTGAIGNKGDRSSVGRKFDR